MNHSIYECQLNTYVCVYTHTYMHVQIYIYIHIISIKNNTKGSQVVSQLAFKVELWNN